MHHCFENSDFSKCFAVVFIFVMGSVIPLSEMEGNNIRENESSGEEYLFNVFSPVLEMYSRVGEDI